MTRKTTPATTTSAPATTTSAPVKTALQAAMDRIAGGLGGVSYNPARTAPVTLPDLSSMAGPVPVTAPASPAPVPAPVKVGALPNETRLQWVGGGHVQKGKSGGYNAWMARQPGPFTVQQAIDAGIPGHHIRYVTGQGWAVRA